MRFHRIKLRNYRGTELREVTFSPTGVTVVEGPNEAGKSSLAEAVQLIFEELDSSKKKEVRDVQPVHRDAGAEVELEVESGPYRFVFFKRFGKKPETTLRVAAPQAESLTGRAAHERANAILAETIDLDLWKALGIGQGVGIQQADLTEQRSLSAALDRAAGVAATGEREETLFAAVRTECLRFFTETGKRKKDLEDAAARVVERAAAVESVKAKLAQLERDVERAADLEREIRKLEVTERSCEEAKRGHDQRLEAIAKVAKDLETLRARLEAAREKEGRAAGESKRRDELARKQDSARADHRRLAAEVEAGAPALARAREEDKQAAAAALERQAEHEAAARLADLFRQDFEYRRATLDLEMLRERHERIEKARKDLRAAAADLAGVRVTEKLLATIEKAHLAFEAARARLESAGPTLEIEALGDVSLEVNDAGRRLVRGQELRLEVADSLRVVFPEVARLVVRPGTSAAELVDAHRGAKEALARLLAEAGVETSAQARAAYESRRTAEHTKESAELTLKNDLRDLTPEDVVRKIDELEGFVASYRARRAPEPPLAPDIDQAKARREPAERSAAELETARRTAEAAHASARERLKRLEKESGEASIQIRLAEGRITDADSALKLARETASDQNLAARREEASAELRVREDAVRDAEKKLADEEPEAARDKAENARLVLERVAADLRRVRDDAIGLRRSLADRGELGLAEELAASEAALERERAECQRLERQARAAKTLHDAFVAERDRSRRAYVAPLRERIEKLGSYVFGASFHVEMDEDLSVTSRTLDDITVPFSSLSIGAQEQIGLIARLACAMVVSPSGGVPVILDDALGSTDPRRLELMGAVLSRAANDVQVIVLTCVPERFTHIGGARVVRLG